MTLVGITIGKSEVSLPWASFHALPLSGISCRPQSEARTGVAQIWVEGLRRGDRIIPQEIHQAEDRHHCCTPPKLSW